MCNLYRKILFITKLAKNIFLPLPFLILLLTISCSSKDPQSTFDTLGPVSALQLELFYISFMPSSDLLLVNHFYIYHWLR